jgi:hypothetical protein
MKSPLAVRLLSPCGAQSQFHPLQLDIDYKIVDNIVYRNLMCNGNRLNTTAFPAKAQDAAPLESFDGLRFHRLTSPGP